MNVKSRIIQYLNSTDREGIDSLIEFLNDSDFYEAPCSTKFHLSVKGGLALHTLNVTDCALDLSRRYALSIPEESVVIAAAAHDLCKIDFYKESDEAITPAQDNYLRSLLQKSRLKYPEKMNKSYASKLIDHLKNNRDKENLPEYTTGYEVKDVLPLGHGEKSLYLASRFIELTQDEALAIRWHMGFSEVGVHFGYPTGTSFRDAIEMSKLVSVISIADLEASTLLEKQGAEPV